MNIDAPILPASPFRTAQQRVDDKVLKRQALLVAAVRMFNDRGYHATSLDDVAASLGMTKPVIYHYLGNKDQVLFECLRRGLADLQAAAESARHTPGTGMSRLQMFLRCYAEVIMGDFGRCVVRTGDQALAPDSRARFRALKRQIDHTLRGMIAAAVADGTAVVGDVRLTAFGMAGALNWCAQWHRDDGAASAGEIADDLAILLCRAITPAPGLKVGDDDGSPLDIRPVARE
jgi:AcrR family transcriptional regulator